MLSSIYMTPESIQGILDREKTQTMRRIYSKDGMHASYKIRLDEPTPGVTDGWATEGVDEHGRYAEDYHECHNPYGGAGDHLVVESRPDIVLEITGIRAQRFRDTTLEDVRKEGYNTLRDYKEFLDKTYSCTPWTGETEVFVIDFKMASCHV